MLHMDVVGRSPGQLQNAGGALSQFISDSEFQKNPSWPTMSNLLYASLKVSPEYLHCMADRNSWRMAWDALNS